MRWLRVAIWAGTLTATTSLAAPPPINAAGAAAGVLTALTAAALAWRHIEEVTVGTEEHEGNVREFYPTGCSKKWGKNIDDPDHQEQTGP